MHNIELKSVTINHYSIENMLIHSLKYNNSTVSGLLLGTFQNSEISIIEVIQGFHSWNELTLPQEAFFGVCKEYAKDKKYQIVGVYFAKNSFNVPDLFVQRLLMTIMDEQSSETIKSPIALEIQNGKLTMNLDTDFKIYTLSNNDGENFEHRSDIIFTGPCLDKKIIGEALCKYSGDDFDTRLNVID